MFGEKTRVTVKNKAQVDLEIFLFWEKKKSSKGIQKKTIEYFVNNPIPMVIPQSRKQTNFALFKDKIKKYKESDQKNNNHESVVANWL